VLQALFEFLGQVAERENYNKMTLNNVAMIFAPNLFPPTWLQKFSPAGDQEGYLNQQVRDLFYLLPLSKTQTLAFLNLGASGCRELSTGGVHGAESRRAVGRSSVPGAPTEAAIRV